MAQTPNSNEDFSQQNERRKKDRKTYVKQPPYSDSVLSSLSSHRGADWIYSDSMLSSLSSHRGADWIITRAPEGSLQFQNGSFLSIIRTRTNRKSYDREATQLSSILITSFSSWNDSILEEDGLPTDGSVIRLLALFAEPSGEDLVLYSCRQELFLTSEAGESVVPLLDCLHDIILIVCGRHLKLCDSTELSVLLLQCDAL
jgi:hypothetical protein